MRNSPSWFLRLCDTDVKVDQYHPRWLQVPCLGQTGHEDFPIMIHNAPQSKDHLQFRVLGILNNANDLWVEVLAMFFTR